MLNSRPAFFSAPPERSAGQRLHPPGGPFSQSYRALLSSSLTEVSSNASGLLSQPTSGGLRYGRHGSITTKLFWSVWVRRSFVSPKASIPSPLSLAPEWICLPRLAYGQGRTMSNRHAPLTLPHPSLVLERNNGGAGILTCCPSPSALAYGLGPTNPTPINVA